MIQIQIRVDIAIHQNSEKIFPLFMDDVMALIQKMFPEMKILKELPPVTVTVVKDQLSEKDVRDRR